MRLFGLIGYPLSHSFSAQYFAKKFSDGHISDAGYHLFPLEDISILPQLIEQQPDLEGFNITIPYKESILPYLDHLTAEATDIGAVNCVKIDRNQPSGVKLTGYNTDIYGFKESLVPLLKSYHQTALILGTGGASKAVSFALKQMGIAYTLVSRSGQRDTTIHYSQITENLINKSLIIINSTPAGMYPHTESCPDIPYQFLGSKHILFDLIYNPAETKFLKMGREAGATTLNGLKMLELQAEKSWEIWNE